ncbi:hypothetical protein [Sebaldella sp. S0638]|uniref:hypothetical protein n=1 Tax=Sebaldella sp. S0638 TaxID=2957809 RepID=UPI0020A11FF0|nr:hypothetical protein [Sebaldella sp. S0638]MCP1226228.1 hypothetical protein [Sebaldella sp. S0638]
MKNKEKLLLLLGLNVVGATAAAADNINVNYDRLYNKMTKNLQTEKANEKSYKFIERILNQKNRELKDLYLQGDYIIKPEYLEWQIFFSGFYAKTDRKGESNFKPYKSQQEVKEIELGINIPVNNINVKDINLNINKVQNPKEVTIHSNVEIPAEPNVELKDIADFNFNNPDVSIPTLFSPPLLDKVSTGFNQYETIGFNNRDNVVIGNSDL